MSETNGERHVPSRVVYYDPGDTGATDASRRFTMMFQSRKFQSRFAAAFSEDCPVRLRLYTLLARAQDSKPYAAYVSAADI